MSAALFFSRQMLSRVKQGPGRSDQAKVETQHEIRHGCRS